MLDGEIHGLSEQFRMDRVRGVRTQARLPAAFWRDSPRLGPPYCLPGSDFNDVLPGCLQRGFHALDPWGNQFQEDRAIARRREIGIPAPARLRDLADRGDTVADTLPQALFHG